MKLIVGLGNPGKKYENSRHNAGFMVLENLLGENGRWGNEAKANALVSRLNVGKEEVVLALPQSYMNLSGQVIVELLKWYKLDINDLIVVHDELDLEFGRIQIRKDIGPAGHNGIKSIIERLRTEDFLRVRVGIGQNDTNLPSEKYVLEDFSKEEIKKMKDIIREASKKLELLVRHGYEEFISKYNN